MQSYVRIYRRDGVVLRMQSTENARHGLDNCHQVAHKTYQVFWGKSLIKNIKSFGASRKSSRKSSLTFWASLKSSPKSFEAKSQVSRKSPKEATRVGLESKSQTRVPTSAVA